MKISTSMRAGSLLALLLFILCSASNIALAQSGKGTISGTVRLTDGTPAAYVSIQLDGTSKGDVTTEAGTFIIHQVSAGAHELHVTLSGHNTISQRVEVRESGTANVSVTLAISQQELEEVTVSSGSAYKADAPSSSLRLNEPLQELPQNIQIITNKALADQQVTSMSDGLIRNVSGATRLEHWGDLYTRINMRGDRAAAFRNGMNITSTWGPLTEDMSFVDHVEFVKGPAGFMMSNGDPSGIYNTVTKKPTGQQKGEAGFMVGSYDFYRATLDLDGKFDKGGKVLYRLNLMDQTKNSFRPYEYNDRYSIAPVISYRLDDRTTLTAEYALQHAKMSDVGSYYVFSTKGYATLPREFTFAEPGMEPTRINDQSLTLNLQHYLSKDWKVTAQAAYFNYQQRGTSSWPTSVDSAGNAIRYVNAWDASNISRFGQVYLNGETQTGAVHHRVLVGLDMANKEYMADWGQGKDIDTPGSFNINNPVYGAPAAGLPLIDHSMPLNERPGVSVLTERYTGLYAQDELGFFDNKLRLTLAGRWTDATDVQYGTIMSAKRFTPRVGLSYSVNASMSFYALYDQTFLPQSGIRRDGKAVLPVTGNNIEAGIKKNWAEGRWNATASVYRILKNNQVSSDPTNKPAESFVVQFGQTQTQGLELDIRGQILPGLSIIANYAYTDSKITKADTSEAAQQTIGNKVPGYATHGANVWLSYRLRNGVLKGLGINVGITALIDRTTWDWGASATPEGKTPDALPDYFRLDGGLSYERNRFTVTLNVFNLLNDYLYTGSYYGYGSNFYYWQAEAGRNQRLGVSYRF